MGLHTPPPQGVSGYTTGETVVQVHFPNGDMCCRWCWVFLQSDGELRRYRCKLTGESIPDPIHQTGQNCPLQIQEERHDYIPHASRRRD